MICAATDSPPNAPGGTPLSFYEGRGDSPNSSVVPGLGHRGKQPWSEPTITCELPRPAFSAAGALDLPTCSEVRSAKPLRTTSATPRQTTIKQSANHTTSLSSNAPAAQSDPGHRAGGTSLSLYEGRGDSPNSNVVAGLGHRGKQPWSEPTIASEVPRPALSAAGALHQPSCPGLRSAKTFGTTHATP